MGKEPFYVPIDDIQDQFAALYFNTLNLFNKLDQVLCNDSDLSILKKSIVENLFAVLIHRYGEDFLDYLNYCRNTGNIPSRN